MTLTVDQVKAGLINEEFFLEIGKTFIAIGYIECSQGDHFADCMGQEDILYDEIFSKKFHGTDALEKAVAYANRKIKTFKL